MLLEFCSNWLRLITCAKISHISGLVVLTVYFLLLAVAVNGGKWTDNGSQRTYISPTVIFNDRSKAFTIVVVVCRLSTNL